MIDSEYWVWFQLLFGPGSRRAELFLNYFENPQELYEEISSGGQACAMLHTLERNTWKTAMEEAQILCRRTRKLGCEIVTPDHPHYPPLLQQIYSKPVALYVRGDLSCVSQGLAVAMVGPRVHTDYGRDAAVAFAGEFARNGVTVVSGLAKGIDTVCHEAAMDQGGKTVGVLGCGLDINYPKGSVPLKHRMRMSGGAVITEYPLGTPSLPQHFPLRNRIISGMCQATVVVEADESSGSLITAHHALDEGRDVFAIPGSVFSPKSKGTNGLIRMGQAQLASTAMEVLEYLGVWDVEKNYLSMHNTAINRTTMLEDMHFQQQPEPELKKEEALPEGLSPEAKQLLGLLGEESRNIQDLLDESGLPVAAAQAALTELEIYGLIKGCIGREFVRV